MIKTSILIVFLFFVGNVFAMDTANTKNAILDEFKKKLLEEEELQQELRKNKTLTNEDLEGLIQQEKTTFKDLLDLNKQTEAEKKFNEEMEKQRQKELENMKKRVEEEKKRREAEEERIKKENEKIAEEEKKLKEEEEKLKKEEEALAKDSKNKERAEKLEKAKKDLKDKFDNLLKRKNKVEEDTNALIDDVNSKVDEMLSSVGTNGTTPVVEKSGVLNKIFNITDTGVSEEFLYTDEYKQLVSNKTNISKIDINKESDIPVIGIQEKNLINFDTTDIPQELLAYKRSEQNRHIPSIMSGKDIQNIAISAIEQNNLSVLRGIVEQTKDPDFLVDKNRTLLSVAIASKNYILSRYLIYSGASINRLDNHKNNPLHISINNYSEEISNLLLENGVDINAQNEDGNTPLMLAILSGQENLVVNLLKKGADVHIKNLNGDDAMSLSIKNNKRKIQQYLREIIREEEYKK